MSNRKATVAHPKVMHFGKVNFAPLLLSLWHFGCIYDSKNMKFSCHMNNRLKFNMNLTHLKTTHQYPEMIYI